MKRIGYNKPPGNGHGSFKKGNFSGREYSLRQRQSARDRARVQCQRPKINMPEPEPIEIAEFSGFPEMGELGKIDSYLLGYIHSAMAVPAVIGNVLVSDTLAHFNDALSQVIFNTLSSLENRVVQAGKSQYARHDREYLKAQLRYYAQSIAALQVNKAHDGLAARPLERFSNLARVDADFRLGIVQSESLNGNHTYHIAYMDEPQRFMPRSQWDYEGELGLIENGLIESPENLALLSGLQSLSEPEKNEFDEWFLRLVKSVAEGYKNKDIVPNSCEAIRLVLKAVEGVDLPKFAGSIIPILRRYLGVKEQAERIQAGLPDAEGLLGLVGAHLAPRGILMVNSNNAYNVAGMRQLDTGRGIALYQKTE